MNNDIFNEKLVSREESYKMISLYQIMPRLSDL